MPETSGALPAQATQHAARAPKRAAKLPAKLPVKVSKRATVAPDAPPAHEITQPAKAVKAVKAVKSAKAAKTVEAPKTTNAPKARAVAATPAEAAKSPKLKLVRDSFTIPADEYAALDVLKRRALSLAHPAKKSEILRAGLQALSALTDEALLAALLAVHTIKTGRPKSRKSGKD